jgi:zinc transport system substrate-binding protein
MVLAGEGQNPHSYEPGPRQMAELAGAAVWILSGTEFEIGLRPKIEALFPALIIEDATRGIRFRPLDEHDAHEDEETSAGDRHTWLGQEPARIMAGHIRDALIAVDPAGAGVYEANCAALLKDIDETFAALRKELAPLRGKTVYVYHPGFGYFLDEFGIVQQAVETGGKEPAPRLLGELIERARREDVAAIFVQAQFPVAQAHILADAIGAKPVVLDPLSADWLDNIMFMGRALKSAMGADE